MLLHSDMHQFLPFCLHFHSAVGCKITRYQSYVQQVGQIVVAAARRDALQSARLMRRCGCFELSISVNNATARTPERGGDHLVRRTSVSLAPSVEGNLPEDLLCIVGGGPSRRDATRTCSE